MVVTDTAIVEHVPCVHMRNGHHTLVLGHGAVHEKMVYRRYRENCFITDYS